ncbi:transposable element Tcb2 transposase [Trichonephila inaurata madagascariensis]|uniref:Transposable element Tcb2 transposase n=1 Tax=Trichonephila inaurata madagascariensis TaxID=2747483 RepID=A0A8X6YV53_9ARAC|nr:transposable element Tcb2 transposase [Trichonephila inaurata madagascariensis]
MNVELLISKVLENNAIYDASNRNHRLHIWRQTGEELSMPATLPGKSNSEDRLTRGFLDPNLRNDDLWWYGPKWLRKSRLKWPKLNDLLLDDKLKNSEELDQDIDNASTFKCDNKEVQYFFNIIKDKDFKNLISSEGITWKFIAELAAWWGHFYQRLMRAIKEPLRKIIDRAQLTFEETMTILVEIENVLNHQPLTYVSDDISDPEPLIPANFLLVGHKNDYPLNFSEFLNNSTTRESFLKRKYYQTKLC